jgi:hypothetical protein
MTSDVDRPAARELAGLAVTHVWTSDEDAVPQSRLGWLARARRTMRPSDPIEEDRATPWRDTASTNRHGWRERAAYLGDAQVFAVDYEVCLTCGLGWVEEPYTNPEYQRCGLAQAGLAALRSQNPGVEWHTLGGHFSDSEPFWASVGTDVRGGYTRQSICSHRKAG